MKYENLVNDEYMYNGVVSKDIHELDKVFETRRSILDTVQSNYQLKENDLLKDQKFLNNPSLHFKIQERHINKQILEYEDLVASKKLDLALLQNSRRAKSIVKTSRLNEQSLPNESKVQQYKNEIV